MSELKDGPAPEKKGISSPSSEPDCSDDEVLRSLLELINCKPEKEGKLWRARCPSCKKRHKTLQFSIGNTGILSVVCSNGCNPEKIIDSGRNHLASPLPDPHFLNAISILDLLKANIPLREFILTPWLRSKDIVLVYAYRGVGKTLFSTGVAGAVAAGGTFLKWSAPKARKVLFVDGELPRELLRDRFETMIQADSQDPDSDLLKIITLDDQEWSGTPNIATREGQELIEDHLEGVELLILDNLSTLCFGGAENEAEGWQPVQDWLLTLRRRGIAVLLMHHAGKSGLQRGTSKREDILDTSIGMKHPKDYRYEDGARFEVHFEKARSAHGKDIEAFEAHLTTGESGAPVWVMRTVEDAVYQRIIEMKLDGVSQREIAREIGRDPSNVSRALKKAREKGDL